MDGIIGGVVLGLIIIAILEICRNWRLIGRTNRELQELRKRVEILEAKLNGLDK